MALQNQSHFINLNVHNSIRMNHDITLFVWHGENFTAKIYTSTGIEQYWSAQIFQELRSHPKILGARRVI